MKSYDISELIDFRGNPDGSLSVVPKKLPPGTTGWFRCWNCERIFDVPAFKPPCPSCGARCTESNQIEAPSPVRRGAKP